MYKLSEIKELIKLVDQSSLHELEIQSEGYRLFLRKPQSVLVAPAQAAPAYNPAAAAHAAVTAAVPAAQTAQEPTADKHRNLHKITSPMVGTFYQAPSPDAPLFVKAGDKIHEKTVVCIIEAMKMMNDIPADVKGEIVEVLVENGQLVEYGQVLFLVKTE